ncbi:MAG: LamG-like jellyroll fold domain-containing protein [Planctomycetota bacterium]
MSSTLLRVAVAIAALCGLATAQPVPIALYEFDEGSGTTVADTSGVSPAVDLTIQDASRVEWGPGFLTLDRARLETVGAATRITDAIVTSGEFSVALWVTQTDTTQDGPARMVSLSMGSSARNFTLGHGGYSSIPDDTYSVRVRTTAQVAGQPEAIGGAGDVELGLQQIVATFNVDDGELRVWVNEDPDIVTTIPGALSNWNNTFRLLVGNEDGSDRPWNGVVHRLAIYDAELGSGDVSALLKSGSGDPDPARVQSVGAEEFAASMPVGGALNATSRNFGIRNASETASVDVRIARSAAWVSTEVDGVDVLEADNYRLGTRRVAKLGISLDQAAVTALGAGTHTATVTVENKTNNIGTYSITVRVLVFEPLPPLPPGPVDLSILPEDRRTIWNPGIYGGVPPDDASAGTFPNGVGPAIQHGATLTPSGGDDRTQIQSALDAAGTAATKASRRFVQLGAGTFNVGSPGLSVPSYVILRGTLAGATRQTVLAQNFEGNFIFLSGGSGTLWTTPVSCVGVQAKGATEIVVSDATGLSVGDVISIDHATDGSFRGPAEGDFLRDIPSPTGRFIGYLTSLWYQRQPYSEGRGVQNLFPDSTERRNISQRCEILEITGNTLKIYDDKLVVHGAPLHSTYYNDPQVYLASGQGEMLRYAGLEDLRIHPFGQNGHRVVFINQAAFCWVDNIEIDGKAQPWSGRHLQLYGQAYRCEIRHSYFHESSSYVQGANGYGIVVGGSENLVEDNVVVTLNKPIVCESTQGGNVIAYNFVDNAVIPDPPRDGQPVIPDQEDGFFQEAAISTHASFCNWDLFEGNQTPNITIDSTHGNNGWEVAFRNWCFGRNGNGYASAYERAISVDGWNWEVTSIGNVLWVPGANAEISPSEVLFTPGLGRSPLSGGPEWVYLIGSNAWNPNNGSKPGADHVDGGTRYPLWPDGFASQWFHRHLDFDYATSTQFVNPESSVSTLPNSLYLESAPAFFDGFTWPWIYPSGESHEQRVLQLPAKVRYDAGVP